MTQSKEPKTCIRIFLAQLDIHENTNNNKHNRGEKLQYVQSKRIHIT